MVLVRVDAVKTAFNRVVRGGMSSEVVRLWQPLPSTLLMNERGTEQGGKSSPSDWPPLGFCTHQFQQFVGIGRRSRLGNKL